MYHFCVSESHALTHVSWPSYSGHPGGLKLWCVCLFAEGILNITTMVCGSKRARPWSDWWKTSNTWPWDSSPSLRNRGGRTCFLTYLPSMRQCFFQSDWFFPLILHNCRLKPVQKVEGITNGMSSGSGQQQQQQSSGLSDISTQVQQYQQFLGESQYQHTIKQHLEIHSLLFWKIELNR